MLKWAKLFDDIAQFSFGSMVFLTFERERKVSNLYNFLLQAREVKLISFSRSVLSLFLKILTEAGIYYYYFSGPHQRDKGSDADIKRGTKFLLALLSP